MPRKQPVSFAKYVETINHYRFEFLKRSDEYLARKEKYRAEFHTEYESRSRSNLTDEMLDAIMKPDFHRFSPDNSGKIKDGIPYRPDSLRCCASRK